MVEPGSPGSSLAIPAQTPMQSDLRDRKGPVVSQTCGCTANVPHAISIIVGAAALNPQP